MAEMNRQTRQAFLFSLVFYSVSALLMLFQLPYAPMLISVSLLLSLIWIVLVIRELMLSPHINAGQRLLWIVFVIFMNIFAGIVYFGFIRQKVLGVENGKK